MSAVGIWGFAKVVARRSAADCRRGWLALLVYAFMSMVAGGHYAVDLPSAYAPEVNGSIMSETLLAAVLGWLAWQRVQRLSADVDAGSAERALDEAEVTRLVQEEEGSSSSSEGGSEGGAVGDAGDGDARMSPATSRGRRAPAPAVATSPSTRGTLRSRSRERSRKGSSEHA